jgi:hypothetical protein
MKSVIKGTGTVPVPYQPNVRAGAGASAEMF